MSSARLPAVFVHPAACVDEPSRIGLGTQIWHFSHVCAGATLGRGCKLGQNVCIAPRVRIGDNVKIQNNVSVYEGVELEDDVFCGPSAVFTNVAIPRSHVPRNRPEDYVRTLVSRGATIGANATIVCGHKIGRFAFIGAGAVVTTDIPAYALAYGNPARVHGFACSCGYRIEFDGGAAVCGECGSSYVMVNGEVMPR